jgi:hypothetical protein
VKVTSDDPVVATTNDAMFEALAGSYPSAGQTLGDLLYAFWSDKGLEYRGTLGYDFLRPAEQGKIDCGKKHFEELSKTTNSKISLELVTNGDDFIDLALSKM